MEIVKSITPRGFEEALRNAVKVPTVVDKIPEIAPPAAESVPATTTDTSDKVIVYYILTLLTITFIVLAYQDLREKKEKKK